jgi:hypothetical protein
MHWICFTNIPLNRGHVSIADFSYNAAHKWNVACVLPRVSKPFAGVANTVAIFDFHFPSSYLVVDMSKDLVLLSKAAQEECAITFRAAVRVLNQNID